MNASRTVDELDTARAAEAGPTQSAPAARVVRIEVPTLVDPEGKVWVLPAARTIPAGAGDLLESVDLDASLAEAMQAAAASLGPGAHCLTMTESAVPGPMSAPLDSWAMAQELVGLDLVGLDLPGSSDSPPLPDDLPAPSGHAFEARVRAPQAGPDARLDALRTPQGPGVRIVASSEVGAVVGSDVVLRIVAHGHDRAAALTRLRRALAQTTAVVSTFARTSSATNSMVSG